MLKVLILSFILLGIAFLGLAFRALFVRQGRFPQISIGKKGFANGNEISLLACDDLFPQFQVQVAHSNHWNVHCSFY